MARSDVTQQQFDVSRSRKQRCLILRGESGKAISFACERYALNLTAIEDYIKHPIPVTQYDADALLTDLTAPKPRVRRRMGQPNRGGGNGPRPARPRAR